MKTRLLLTAVTLAWCVSPAAIHAAEPPPPPAGERLPPERFETTVIKVIAASDGTAIFRAYLVKWKDQEVIASDPLAQTDHREGDTITVLAMNHPFPQGKKPHRLLGFTVIPNLR